METNKRKDDVNLPSVRNSYTETLNYLKSKGGSPVWTHFELSWPIILTFELRWEIWNEQLPACFRLLFRVPDQPGHL